MENGVYNAVFFTAAIPYTYIVNIDIMRPNFSKHFPTPLQFTRLALTVGIIRLEKSKIYSTSMFGPCMCMALAKFERGNYLQSVSYGKSFSS